MELLDLAAFAAGLVLATVTAPVGVSGAVFLLPFQVSVLHVPSPQVTPTNLLYNVVAAPGALARYLRGRRVDARLAALLTAGALPAIALGATIRVYLVPDADLFRVIAAGVLVPIGVLLLGGAQRRRQRTAPRHVRARIVLLIAFGAGLAGGVYGIGGGSLVGPALVGLGMSITRVGPAALTSTWLTSLGGVGVFLLLDAVGAGRADAALAAPDWSLGLAAGLGGLIGGWLGARLHGVLPEIALERLLGAAALSIGALYLMQALDVVGG
ncbi:sulfite exporter TauE/SafE family protein [Nocardioides sp. R-C-SC26]|uniref:sulfite exporter TauE/SafE family protein n=1 Tax=Nocardioides sp. R-C-SC26 TaxID=2870414 RepID=UPI001E48480A|nr:sulfite exporter TauE/SafE family protein [Nocardioides sp. R-C-SC26]